MSVHSELYSDAVVLIMQQFGDTGRVKYSPFGGGEPLECDAVIGALKFAGERDTGTANKVTQVRVLIKRDVWDKGGLTTPNDYDVLTLDGSEYIVDAGSCGVDDAFVLIEARKSEVQRRKQMRRREDLQ